MNAPKISLCVITKDEERVLPRLLRSVQGVVDEIVVVDTGSTDATVEVAKSFGARVLHQAFDDDFSAVRNVALEAATQPWILVLDADEVLAPGSGRYLRAAAADDRIAGAYLKFENDLGGGRSHVCGLMRFFRNDPSIRFEYVIHEQALPSIAAFARTHGLRLAQLDQVRVYHDGYLPTRRDERSKDERNERLFRKQVERHPDHTYSWYKFGDFLRRLPERRAEGIQMLERAEALLVATPDDVARDLSFPAEVHALLALERDKLGRTDAALDTAVRGRERFGDTPNLLFVLGHLFTKTRRWRDAFLAYAHLRAFDGKLCAIPPEPGVTGPIAMAGLGLALRGMKRPRAAIRCLEHAVRLDPSRVQNQLLLGEIRAEQGDVGGAVTALRTAIELDPKRHAARLRVARLLLCGGDSGGAEHELLAGLEHGLPVATAIPLIAEARIARGDLEAAYLALAEAPDDPDCAAGLRVLGALARGSAACDDAASLRWLKLVRTALRPLSASRA